MLDVPISALQKRILRVVLLIFVAALQACATSGVLNVARDQFRHGSTSDALQTLAEADVSRRDRLLLYLDRGMIAQAAGRYEDSFAAFERATSLIDELDYVSVKDQSAALLSSDWATRYSGEYSERLWVHTFQMLNFLMLDLPQEAAVEARRAVALYEKYGDVLKQDIFTRSVMALSFMAAGQRDSAGVEYRKLTQDFGLSLPESLSANQSELILFIASGFIATKLPGDLLISVDARISFPYYPPFNETPPTVQVLEDSRLLPIQRADSVLAAISSQALADRGKRIAARQALRVATKYSISESIEDHDALAGGIVKLLFLAIEQADTRSWETLPAYLTLVRVPLTPGAHSLTLQINGSDNTSGFVTQRRTLDVDLDSGQQIFRLIRLGVNPD